MRDEWMKVQCKLCDVHWEFLLPFSDSDKYVMQQHFVARHPYYNAVYAVKAFLGQLGSEEDRRAARDIVVLEAIWALEDDRFEI